VKFYCGKLFDVGQATATIERVFKNSLLGVNIAPQDSGVLSPWACRKLAVFLLEAADWCEKQNEKKRSRSVEST
jgi:hypothetical protein